jgi:Spy/CpxP family protein refolding chaperone
MRLSSIFRSVLCAALVLSFASVTFAQEGGGQGGGRGGRGGRGGAGGGAGGGFGGGFGIRTNELTNALEVLGDLNLSPDFSLDKEQKTKIKAVREEYTKAMEKWRTDNEEKLTKIREEMRGTQGDRDAMQAIMTKQRELYATAPKADEPINQVKAALTAEQKATFEKALAERAERRGAGGPGGPGGRGQGAGGEGGGRRRGADL